MKRRITQFDYIRVFSLFGILICHSCYCFATTEWVGRYFGLTFNFLFLALSALLFGMSWNSNGRVSYKKDFLQRRFAKLSKSYYSYLVILFLFLYLTEDYFSWKHIVTHFLYLPWFYKINGFGHLWFLSMIAICYVGIYIISHIKPRQTGNYLAISTLIGGYFVGLYY